MKYLGLHRSNGRAVSDLDHLRQSINDILMTPIGTRLERRDYGSDFTSLIDQPFNATTRLQAMAVIVMALAKWEPRIQITALEITLGDAPGQFLLKLDVLIIEAGISSESTEYTATATPTGTGLDEGGAGAFYDVDVIDGGNAATIYVGLSLDGGNALSLY